ncbi:hypothetical protein BBJ28_00018732 [Nothophytophthora sp. Chile5]|nr:hypothetical protein BBJ28_00018732 [Nothophytophthora sp. Chile5]
MDSRVLWSGAALQAHRYAIAYTSKQQSVMDNAAVVDLAYRKRLEREREQVQSNTEFQRGIGRLMSLAFATSGVMEIGGPLATTILLDGAAAKFSCKFERLVLLEGLNIMDDVDVEATQYYLCLEAAQTFRQKIVHADDEADTSDEDIECSQDAQVNFSGQERLSFVAIYEDLYTASHGSDETVDGECENGNASCASEPLAVQTLLTTTLSNADLPEDKTDYLRALNRSVLEKEAREFEKKCRQPQCGLDLNALGDASFSERNSVLVEKLEEVVRHLEFRPCDNVLMVLPQYATIQDVSIRYTLNREQHAAFVLFAAPLLFKIVNKPIPAHLAGVFDTAPLIVTGAGGTGKSRIVDAVRGLVSAWNRPNAVMVVGTTGIAAANLNGQLFTAQSESASTCPVISPSISKAQMKTCWASNQCIPKGVANGALGKIYHMDWASGTSFSKKSNGVWMASREPVNIYVDVEDAVCPLPFPGLPPTWPTSVMPVCQAKSTFKLQGRSIAIKGYPVVPAFGTTVHGVQGATRDEIAITNLRPAHLQRVDRHALYVALSRLRTRYGLSWIGPRLTEEDFNYFRPQDEVLAENNRLEELARHTMEAIKQYDFALFPETQN